jgi:hypothetical protein
MASNGCVCSVHAATARPWSTSIAHHLHSCCSSTRPAYLGVTPPISTEPPSERHKQMTETLMAELKAQGQFESAEDARLRYVQQFAVRWLLLPQPETFIQQSSTSEEDNYSPALYCDLQRSSTVEVESDSERVRVSGRQEQGQIRYCSKRSRRQDLHLWFLQIRCTWSWSRYRYIGCCASARQARGLLLCHGTDTTDKA